LVLAVRVVLLVVALGVPVLTPHSTLALSSPLVGVVAIQLVVPAAQEVLELMAMPMVVPLQQLGVAAVPAVVAQEALTVLVLVLALMLVALSGAPAVVDVMEVVLVALLMLI